MRTLSEEHRRNISKSLIGRKRPVFSKEWLKHLSDSHKGRTLSTEHKKTISLSLKGKPTPWLVQFGEKNTAWNGTRTGYHAIHKWVNIHWQRPKKCENCGTTTAKRFEWANLDKQYDRLRRESWARLCSSCHIKFDRYGHQVSINFPLSWL